MIIHYLISVREVLVQVANKTDELIERASKVLDSDVKHQTLENVIERLLNVVEQQERWIDHLEEMIFEDR